LKHSWYASPRDNPAWGYDRIVGALRNLGYRLSDQTIGNILQRNGPGPSPERRRNTAWASDFFTTEIWTRWDCKNTQGFDEILKGAGIAIVKLLPHSPNLNAFAERFAKSIKTECLEQFVLFGENSLWHVIR